MRDCEKCGKSFKPKGDFKGRAQKYCSKACWSNRVGKTKKICLICHQEFLSYKKQNRKYCSVVCREKSKVGRKLTQEHKNNISKANKGFMPVNVFKEGKEHPNYILDRSKLKNLRDSREYINWANAVIDRDKICIMCEKEHDYLHAHHIKSYKDFPDLRLEIDNGAALCPSCHITVHAPWNAKKSYNSISGKTEMPARCV